MNKDWYYRGNLNPYLAVAIWGVGFVAPFMIAAVAGNLLIARWVAGYEPLALLVIYCNLWIRSGVFAVGFPTFTACLGLALLLGVLFKDPSYKVDKRRKRFVNPVSEQPREKVWQSQRTPIQKFLSLSLQMAMKEQGLGTLYQRLEKIVPDVSHQYNTDDMDNIYWTTKIRAEQTLHVGLSLRAIEEFDAHSIMDIGDSSGAHIIYLMTLSRREMRTKSLNIDHEAIGRIKSMHLDVVEADAEKYDWSKESYDMEADAEKYDWSKESYDMLLAFDMLEHLRNPGEFLRKLSKEAKCKVLVISVPYLRRSRVTQKKSGDPRSTHIYELSPEDWQAKFRNSGWTINYDQIYYQYPRRIPIVSRLLRRFWRRNDFEGFYGAVLTPNDYRGVFTVVRDKEEQRAH